MLFNSLHFLVFFPVVTALYFMLPHKYRWALLLGSSCYFYMSFIPVYILILFITIIIDYFAGIWIEQTHGRTKKIILIGSILSTCLVLFIFKYFNFFNDNLAALALFLRWNYPVESLGWILPVGLSFHTFQSLSYVVEVYRGKQKAEHNFGIYSLYVMFFPQLVAGPIERPQNLLHQFYEEHRVDYHRITDGLKLMLWGAFKKIVIADKLALIVNHVYEAPEGHPPIVLVLATVFFAFQIYCDFSGYSDIAIGSAQVLGFKLMDNFNRPYFAKSVPEFWKRWHISLSTWFKDYVYIPLGGSRAGPGRLAYNIMITFMISGLWHGASWTYVIWGALNGFYVAASGLTGKWRRRIADKTGLSRAPVLHKIFQVGVVFTLISFAWIFFRAANVQDAFLICERIFLSILHPSTFAPNGWADVRAAFSGDYYNTGSQEVMIGIFFILVMEFVHFIQRHGRIRHMLNERPVWVRWPIYYFLIFSILIFGEFQNNQFIYFQF